MQINEQNGPQIAVCMPVFRGSKIIGATLRTLLNQTYTNYKVYIRDDTPPEDEHERRAMQELITGLDDERFTYLPNEENVGYPRNLQNLINDSSEEFIFLLAQDDELSPIAIESCLMCFHIFPHVAAVARPYFWYQKSLDHPVRMISPLDRSKPTVVSAASDIDQILHVLVSASQLTGLMYQRSKLTENFIDSVFPAHIYPVAGAIRDHSVCFLPHHTVAVSIEQSQTRTVSSIYRESPAEAWAKLYTSVFSSQSTRHIMRAGLKKHMGQNFVGLIQIRSYGRYRYLWREALVMVRLRPMNVVDPRFLGTVLSLGLLPRSVTRKLTDLFKEKVLSRRLTGERLASIEDSWWKVT